MPFAWGKHDCCHFACIGLTIQGLKNPMSDVGAYRTASGAMKAIKRLGGSLDTAATALALKVGLREINPAFAGRGCVVLADIETEEDIIEPSLGLVSFDGTTAQFAGSDELVWRPLTDCRRAWGFD